MSGLNFLNKLLDGVDVEWLSLGELGDFIRGNGLQKKDFVESGFPAIHYGQIYTRYGLSADKTFTYVLPELANKLRKAQKNDLLLATTSENDEDVVKPLAWLGDNVAISGDMMLFRHEQNVKYLAYFFQSEIFQTQKMKYITGAKVRRVSSGDLSKIKIPIPCSNNPEKSLTIQSEIVRILDRFTALTAELTAELTMRKNQYNYYRDQLLCFDEAEVEWKTLADVAILRRGRVMSKGYLEQNAGDYPVYSSQTARNGMIGSIDTYDFDGEFISWTTDGANAGTVFYRTGKFSITNVCGLIKIHENYPISYKYLYYWLSIEAQ
ncbi:restriction endonuclease subunit S, partial [Citrobacter portucalensis]